MWSTEQRHGLECLWSGDDVMSRVTMKAIRATELILFSLQGHGMRLCTSIIYHISLVEYVSEDLGVALTIGIIGALGHCVSLRQNRYEATVSMLLCVFGVCFHTRLH